MFGTGGYVYHDATGSSYQTALDMAGATDPVDAYLVIDGCRFHDLVGRAAQSLVP